MDEIDAAVWLLDLQNSKILKMFSIVMKSVKLTSLNNQVPSFFPMENDICRMGASLATDWLEQNKKIYSPAPQQEVMMSCLMKKVKVHSFIYVHIRILERTKPKQNPKV